MSTSVCLSVRKDISGTTRAIFHNLLCMLPMTLARSSSSVVAICYVGPFGFVDDIIFSIMDCIAVRISLQRTDFS